MDTQLSAAAAIPVAAAYTHLNTINLESERDQ
jgi:hypothetical protein